MPRRSKPERGNPGLLDREAAIPDRRAIHRQVIREALEVQARDAQADVDRIISRHPTDKQLEVRE